MKAAALAALLAACGGGHDADCVRLVDHLAEVMGARADQRDDAIARCEEQKPAPAVIECALAATTPDRVRACLAPAKGTR